MKLSARMKKILYWSGGTIGVLGLLSLKRQFPRSEIAELLSAEADRQGVDVRWVMAWAQKESNFHEDAEGDLNWPFRSGGRLYRENVLDNRAYDANPFRSDQAAWHSYGLFQLLSPHWLSKAESTGLVAAGSHPSVLLDPHVNAKLGVGMLKALYERTGGDFIAARMIAAGCHGCATAPLIAARARLVMRQWGLA